MFYIQFRQQIFGDIFIYQPVPLRRLFSDKSSNLYGAASRFQNLGNEDFVAVHAVVSIRMSEHQASVGFGHYLFQFPFLQQFLDKRVDDILQIEIQLYVAVRTLDFGLRPKECFDLLAEVITSGEDGYIRSSTIPAIAACGEFPSVDVQRGIETIRLF